MRGSRVAPTITAMTDFPPPPPYEPPPAYATLESTGVFGGRFRPIRGIGKALVVLNALWIAVSVLVLLLQFRLHNSAVTFRQGGLSTSDFVDKLAPFMVVSVVSAGLGIAILVLQCIWSFRMASNLQVLGRQPQTWKPGWGIAVWLLSGCTLGILPFLMTRELWKGSDPDLSPGDPRWKTGPTGPAISVWFGLQIASVIVGVAAGMSAATYGVGSTDRDSIAKALDQRLPLVVISGLLTVAVTAAFIAMVRQLSDLHMRATQEL